MNEKDLREFICHKFLNGDMDFPIESETKLLEEGICDSLGLVQIVSEIEGRYPALRIPDQEVNRENFGSIAAIMHYIGQKHLA